MVAEPASPAAKSALARPVVVAAPDWVCVKCTSALLMPANHASPGETAQAPSKGSWFCSVNTYCQEAEAHVSALGLQIWLVWVQSTQAMPPPPQLLLLVFAPADTQVEPLIQVGQLG